MAFIQNQEHKSQLIESIKREIAKGTTRQQCKDTLFEQARTTPSGIAAMTDAFFETDLLVDQVYNIHESVLGSVPDNPNPVPAPAEQS